MFSLSIVVFLVIVAILFLAQIGPMRRRKQVEAELHDNVVLLKATVSGVRPRREKP